MDGLHDFLADLKQRGQAAGQFLGLLNVLIGRSVQKEDGSPICNGVTWRELSFALKKVRWEPDAIRDLGLEPDQLPPRDRQRYWYTAIAQAQVDSPRATEAGNRLAETLRMSGYRVSAAPEEENSSRKDAKTQRKKD